jgi:cell division protein FtsZ
MQELNRHVGDETQILFGTAVDGRMGNRMAVTLISSLAADGTVVERPVFTPPAAAPKPTYVPPPAPQPAAAPAAPLAIDDDVEEMMFAAESLPEPERPLKTIEAKMAAPEPQPDLLQPEESEPEFIEDEPEPIAEAAPPPAMLEPEPEQPRVILPAKKKLAPPKELKPAAVEKIVQAKQEVLQFESVTRGRFEKSEPTIVEGQDLDVPTFLRKNVRVK